MKFAKYHGLGNDFIIINALEEQLPASKEKLADLALKMCHRKFGIGADGLLIVRESKKADFFMQIINSDGSEAKMCGNGIRCLSRYLYEKGLVGKKIYIETLAGIKVPEILDDFGAYQIKVDMGEPELRRENIPMLGNKAMAIKENLEIDGVGYLITALSMGNPHCVLFVDSLENIPLNSLGAKIEKHSIFLDKTNVEWVEIVNKNYLKMRVFERGAGETLACGTGACASLVAANLNGFSDKKATVELLGGRLEIKWEENNHVYMTGSAVKVFTGDYFIDKIKS